MTEPRIGTAGWAIPRQVADRFPTDGTGLQRYAARFNAVEINSTFYRTHRPRTLARWRETTPAGFRFSLKVARAITHEAKLAVDGERLDMALEEARQLGNKLGPLLIQLPPSLAFDRAVAKRFFAALRDRFSGPVACEPRHASWFEDGAEHLLVEHRIARVAADPARHPLAARPGGWPGLAYWRLHGSPRMYFSAYDGTALRTLADQLAQVRDDVWCVFDNTASGAAAGDALRLGQLIDPREL